MSAIQVTPSTRNPTSTSRANAAAAAAELIIDPDVDPFLKACIYARNKVGKTRFAASSELKTLIIDCNEKGWDSVRKRKNVKIYPVKTWEDVDPIFWYLKTGKHDFEVVVIDTVTMLAMLGMKFVLKDDYDRDMSRDPQTPDKRSWGKLGEMMKDAMIKFRNLDMHVIFLAQEKMTTSDDDEGGTIVEVHPELSPAPRSTLLSSVGLIGRMYVKEIEINKGGQTIKRMERRMLLGNHPKYASGNRYEELRNIERNPNLQDFLNRIFGEAQNADAAQSDA